MTEFIVMFDGSETMPSVDIEAIKAIKGLTFLDKSKRSLLVQYLQPIDTLEKQLPKDWSVSACVQYSLPTTKHFIRNPVKNSIDMEAADSKHGSSEIMISMTNEEVDYTRNRDWQALSPHLKKSLIAFAREYKSNIHSSEMQSSVDAGIFANDFKIIVLQTIGLKFENQATPSDYAYTLKLIQNLQASNPNIDFGDTEKLATKVDNIVNAANQAARKNLGIAS